MKPRDIPSRVNRLFFWHVYLFSYLLSFDPRRVDLDDQWIEMEMLFRLS